jgi:formylglycine-generating enzyme required for sulfatase activity
VKIFLSYRASDMQGQAPLVVGKIVQRLGAHYGAANIILERPIVPEGSRFDGIVKGLVGQADVVLAVIGPDWARSLRSLADSAEDFVRAELLAAMQMGIPVIPVLLNETPMPGPDDLPDALADLAGMQRFRLSTGSDMAPQLLQLTHHLDSSIRSAAPTTPMAVAAAAPVAVRPHRESQPRKRNHTTTLVWLVAILAMAGVMINITPKFQQQATPRPDRDPTNDYLNSIGDRMVWCPPGTFVMGSPETEEGHSKDELQHEVTLTTGFWIGAHEITQAQWKLVTGSFHASHVKKQQTALPVTMISWDEAAAFCDLISAQEGRNYKLPTEAQWEYACRAGMAGPQNREGMELNDLGWHEGNSGGVPHLVGEKARNNWGLQDMHGNVFEWCRDVYEPYAAAPVIDPAGPEKGEFRIYRGSAFDIGNPYHRSAYRSWNKAEHRAPNLGLRIVSLPDPRPRASAPKAEEGAAPTPPPKSTPGMFAEQPDTVQLNRREDEIAPDIKVRFLYCPPGKFMMGEGASAHEVTLSQGFWLGEGEISRGQWRAVMGKKADKDGPNRGYRVPIDSVSWDDIAGRGGFLEKIKSKAPAGWQFTLPTEAQWEYACRGGTTTAYSWGDEFVDGKANVSNAPGTDESHQVAYFQTKGLPTGGTMAVKTLDPNPWGFHDMHGNVWEWCLDWFTESPISGATTDPQGPSLGDLKVLRGGSWSDPEAQAKSTARLRYFPTFRGAAFGFRLAMIPKP